MMLAYLTLANAGWLLGVLAGLFAAYGSLKASRILTMLQVVIAEVEKAKSDPVLREKINSLCDSIRQRLESIGLESTMNPIVNEVQAKIYKDVNNTTKY